MICPPKKPMTQPRIEFAQERHCCMRPTLVADEQDLDQQQGEKHRKRIVGAELDLQHGPHARPQPQAACIDEEENGGSVGRRHNRAQEKSLNPAETEDDFRHRRGEHRRDQHADRGKHNGRPQHIPEAGEARPQAPVEQNERQRDRTDGIGRGDIVELESARSALAGHHADQQEYQEQRSAEAQRDQARQDAGKNQQAAEQYGKADSVERGHGANLRPL